MSNKMLNNKELSFEISKAFIKAKIKAIKEGDKKLVNILNKILMSDKEKQNFVDGIDEFIYGEKLP